MDPRVEAALACVLDRAEAGADVSEGYLREAYPDCWPDLAEFLSFFGRLRRGRPRCGTLGPYGILRRLGQGGMGTVYVAQLERAHEGLAAGTQVAVKVVHRHLLERPGFLERTLREARLGRTVVHPNVVRTLDVGVETRDGIDEAYLVTEYVEGQNLRGLLHDTGAVPEHLCRVLARGILEGLAAIHASGLVHRDLKPENVVIGRSGAPPGRDAAAVAGPGDVPVVKVMDLGAARPAEELTRLAGRAEFAGSILYAAPEQFDADAAVDGRADLYALGVMLHELAAGRHPFADGVRRGPLRRAKPSVSAFFDEFVGRLASDAAGARFASASEALAALAEGGSPARDRARGAAARAAPEVAAFVGRAEELAALEHEFARAASGEDRVVLVEGEAGAGKSRLFAEFASRIARRDPPPWVMTVRGDLATALRDVLGTGAAALPGRESLAPAFEAWLCGTPCPEGAAALTPESLPAAVGAALRAAAGSRPLVVVAEDLHEAPAERRELLAALARCLRGGSLLAAATRPVEGRGATPPLVPSARVLALGRLGADDLRALLAAATAPEPPSARLEALAAHWSGGNPYFLLEIVAALRDDGLLVAGRSGGWRLAEDAGTPRIPDTLRELVRARVDALSGDDRDVLAAAACCGSPFDPAEVAAALGTSAVRVSRRLARIEARHRLVRGVHALCEFDHPLVREALLEGLGRAEAARLHAALARSLERAGDEAARGRAARHFLLAGDAARAAPHLAPALAALSASFRLDEALELCDLALAAPDGLDPARRLAVLRAKAEVLGVLARRPDELDAVREALAAARALGLAADAAALRASLARCLHSGGRHDDALAEARRALAEADAGGDAAPRIDAQAVLAAVLGHVGREEEALAHAEAHLALCRESRDGERVVAALVLLAETLRHLNRLADAHDHLEQAVAAARSLAPGLKSARTARLRLGKSLASIGRIDEAARALGEAVAAARSCADRGDEIEALEALSLARSRLGDWDEALRCAELAAELAEGAGDANAHVDALVRCASVLKWTGRWADALERYDRALGLCVHRGYRLGEATTRAYRAIQLAYAGDAAAARDDARAALELVRAGGFDTVLPLVLWAAGLADGDVATLREAARLAGPGVLPPVRAEIALAVAAAGFGTGAASAADAEAALAAGRAANLPSVAVVASAYLAALGRLPAATARAELERDEARLPVGRRLEARFVLWRVTGERSLLDGARGDLALLAEGAPVRCRESLVRDVPLHAAVAAADAA